MGESGVKENDCIVKIDYDLQRLIDASSGKQQWEKRSIYKLPACITDRNVKAYRPQAVSFGPYHNGEDHLSPMEEHKHRALAHFLKRTRKPLHELLKCLREVVQDLRNSYHPLDWDDDKSFLQMMLLDGCFMLEILLTKVGGDKGDGAYDDKDPIFSKHGEVQIMPYIMRDMLMLENQLPLLVLDKLFFFVPHGDDKKEMSVVTLIHEFWPTSTTLPVTDSCFHILDVVRKGHIQKCCAKHTANSESHYYTDEKIIRSATELNEAGIDFERSKTESFTDISFKSVAFGGILMLPVILVDDATESKLLNMLAFERLHVGLSNEVASYVFLMDNIIENEKDIALLHASGIIQNAMGSAKAAADLFNSLSKDTTLDPASSLSNVHNDVHGFCKKRRNKYRATLWHKYFTSPWTIISLVAAILLFILTFLQTYYTIYPYYNPREKSK